MTARHDNPVLNHRSLHRLVDNAAGEFAVAADALTSVAALFEAIVAATNGHELAHRLAKLGMDTATEYADSYEGATARYNEHSRSIIDAMG